jgi:hypothetical protein
VDDARLCEVWMLCVDVGQLNGHQVLNLQSAEITKRYNPVVI